MHLSLNESEHIFDLNDKALIKGESNFLKRKCIEIALIARSFMVNLLYRSYILFSW